MRFLTKLFGLALVVAGIYFLGKNIYFTTYVSSYWWRDISAAGSVLSILGGVISLIFFPQDMKMLGGALVFLGIVLVFINGSVVLKPTSLWYLFLSFSSLIGGLKLMSTGRINF